MSDLISLGLAPQTVPFSFGQYTVLFLIIAIPLLVLAGYATIRGIVIKRKDTTIVIAKDGSKKKISKTKTFDMVLLMEVMKMKDDLHKVESIAFEKQKKYAREVVDTIKDKIIVEFANLLRAHNDNINRFADALITNHNYNYFILLMEKASMVMLSIVMKDFEENGLASKKNQDTYVYHRSLNVVNEGYEKMRRFYILGIDEVPIEVFEKCFDDIRHDLINLVAEVYKNAIEVSKGAFKKKQSIRDYITTTLSQINELPEAQINTFFTDITSDDI